MLYKNVSLLKAFGLIFRRMISGCYHDVCNEYFQSYIDEVCVQFDMYGEYWSSTEYDEEYGRLVNLFNGKIGGNSKDYGGGYVRAFLRLK